MAHVTPINGIHFDPEKVDLTEVIAPPYDVLSPNDQARLYERHPANIVRLILNARNPDEDEAAPYIRAAEFLQGMLEDRTLVRDPVPAYYEYVQRFEHPHFPGTAVERMALFVALKLQPYSDGVVLPHEETHPKAKADRLALMRATNTNPEPIYGLYEDPDGSVAALLADSRGASTPMLQAVFPSIRNTPGDQHLVYRHRSASLFRALDRFFDSRRIWIADGHHRYETALNFQKERRAAEGEVGADKPYDHILVGLSAFEDKGLVVLPTHRMVRCVASEMLAHLTRNLERFFQVQETPLAEGLTWMKQRVDAEKRFLVLKGDGALALTLSDVAAVDKEMDPAHCPAWRRLDVSLLQTLVLDRCLGISWGELAYTQDVAYTRDQDEAIEKVRTGEFQLAFLLQDPTETEVRDVALAGDKMPQKSTFFYPKLWSGLILRDLS